MPWNVIREKQALHQTKALVSFNIICYVCSWLDHEATCPSRILPARCDVPLSLLPLLYHFQGDASILGYRNLEQK